jgi:hypothetical protein
MPSRTSPLILTLKLEQAAFDRLGALRRAYFPPGQNGLWELP